MFTVSGVLGGTLVSKEFKTLEEAEYAADWAAFNGLKDLRLSVPEQTEAGAARETPVQEDSQVNR